YFVTSADSNTYVLAVISSDGRMNPSRPLLGMWGLLTGATAAVLLYAGGLEALQTAVMLSAAPFIFVILALAISLVMMLRRDPLIQERATARHPATTADEASAARGDAAAAAATGEDATGEDVSDEGAAVSSAPPAK
ncbi:MAG: BCCT family transporter, partial [Brachybacterium sp.]